MKLLDSQIVELGKAFVQSGLLSKNVALSKQEYCEFIASNTMDYMEALRELSDD
jgi:hypothetical protein